jgi:penicillin-binding protein 1A
MSRDGKILEENKPKTSQAITAETANQLTQILMGVIQEGTGKKAQGLPVAAAGKTGTTDKNTDAWFIGYTPLLATGVWYGFDQNKSLGKSETGGTTAAPVWLDFMKNARDYLKADSFEFQEGMNRLSESITGSPPSTPETGKSFWDIFR